MQAIRPSIWSLTRTTEDLLRFVWAAARFGTQASPNGQQQILQNGQQVAYSTNCQSTAHMPHTAPPWLHLCGPLVQHSLTKWAAARLCQTEDKLGPIGPEPQHRARGRQKITPWKRRRRRLLRREHAPAERQLHAAAVRGHDKTGRLPAAAAILLRLRLQPPG